MKKSSLVIFFVSVLLLFTSCERNPISSEETTQEKKISKIIEECSYDEDESICEEIWEWNGNQIRTITKHYYYYEYGMLEEEDVEIAQFFYQNNKISTITDGHTRYELFYQNDRLSSVKCYDMNDNPEREYTYEYNGDNLTKVSHYMPSLSISEEYYFEWLEGNVARIKYYNDGDYVSSYSFRYDNKGNPFHDLCVNFYDNLFNSDVFVERFLFPSSKNNVISGSHSSVGSLNFTYTYDENYPLTRKCYLDGTVITTRYEYQD